MTVSSDTSHSVRILYVAGSTRSGTTLLGKLLGEMDGCSFVGEVLDYWELLDRADHQCACGARLDSCPVWRSVQEAGVPHTDPAGRRAMVALRDDVARSRAVPVLLAPWTSRAAERRRDEYRSALAALYHAMATATACHTLIDSSKNAGYAALLSSVGGLDVRVLHLVRDPRAVAYSWQRAKGGFEHRGPAHAATEWLVRNGGTELLRLAGRLEVARIRYEELVEEPTAVIAGALDQLGLGSWEPPAVDGEHRVELGVNHCVEGNTDRSIVGPVALRSDDEWIERRGPHRWIPTAVTLPLLAGYRYPVAPRAVRTREEQSTR